MGFTYRGKHNLEMNMTAQVDEVSILPEINTVMQEVPNRSGSYYIKSKRRPKIIPVEVGFHENDRRGFYERLRLLAGWLEPSKGIGEFINDDDPGIIYYAVLDGSSDLRKLARIGQGIITFLCPDPNGYGPEHMEIVGVSGDPNATIPTVFAAAASGQMTVEGTAIAWPTIEVEFEKSASDYQISHIETGKSVRIIWNFVAGDKLTIDSTRRKIIINNNIRMTAYDVRTSSWFGLLAGRNRFTISPDVAKTTIRYREGWL